MPSVLARRLALYQRPKLAIHVTMADCACDHPPRPPLPRALALALQLRELTGTLTVGQQHPHERVPEPWDAAWIQSYNTNRVFVLVARRLSQKMRSNVRHNPWRTEPTRRGGQVGWRNRDEAVAPGLHAGLGVVQKKRRNWKPVVRRCCCAHPHAIRLPTPPGTPHCHPPSLSFATSSPTRDRA